jgi:carboxylesterase
MLSPPWSGRSRVCVWLNGKSIAIAPKMSRQPAVLLVHGFSGSAASLADLDEQFRAAGFATARPTLPGHDGQPGDLLTVTASDWCQAVTATYRELAQTHDHILCVGFSFGGSLVLKLAQHWPVTALVTINTPVRLAAQSWQRYAVRLLRHLKPYHVKTSHGPSATEVMPARLGRPYELIAHQAIRQMFNFLEAEMNAGQLARVSCPVMIIQSRRDPVIARWSAEAIYRSVGSTRKSLALLALDQHNILSVDQFPNVIDRVVNWSRATLNQHNLLRV